MKRIGVQRVFCRVLRRLSTRDEFAQAMRNPWWRYGAVRAIVAV